MTALSSPPTRPVLTPGRLMDARFLELMGIEYAWRMRNGWDEQRPPRHALWQRNDYENGRSSYSIAPEFSTSSDAFAHVEATIKAKGLSEAYAKELAIVAAYTRRTGWRPTWIGDGSCPITPVDLAKIVFAPLWQRAQAAMTALTQGTLGVGA